MEAQNRDSPGQSRMTGHQQAGCLARGQRLGGGGSCVLSVGVGRAMCRGMCREFVRDEPGARQKRTEEQEIHSGE